MDKRKSTARKLSALTPYQLTKARKAQARYMNRSRAAYVLMNKRAKHNFSLETLRTMIRKAIGTDCPYCGDIITAKTFSPDHREPLSRNGKPSNKNIEIVCLKCNHAKGALTAMEFHQVKRLLNSMDSIAQQDILGRLRLGAAAKARWSRRWKR